MKSQHGVTRTRRKYSLIIFFSLCCASLPSIAAAQSVRAKAALASMKVSLRKLAVEEEKYFSRSGGSYTNDISKLALRTEKSVSVTVFKASEGGWVARATHLTLPGKSCLLKVGEVKGQEPRTDDQDKIVDTSGDPVCDDL